MSLKMSSDSDYVTACDRLQPPIFKLGAELKPNLKIAKYLGAGTFGALYVIYDTSDFKHYVLKIELHSLSKEDPGLQIEVNILKIMQKNGHFPRFVRAGHHKNLCYLIMQIVGPNLDYLRKQCHSRKFSMTTAHHLAYQCLEALQALHLENLIHRDVRPSHFAIGSTAFDCRNVYILDYHLVRRFTRKDGQVRPARHKVRTKGCFKYASPNSLKDQDISRPDDLYSWFYMNIEFLKGRLPWRELKNKTDILHIKSSNIDDLLNDLPRQWSKIFNSVSKLTFEQDPPYYEYKSLILEVVNRENGSFDEPFDWELGGKSYANFTEPLAVYLRMPARRNRSSSDTVAKESIRREPSTIKNVLIRYRAESKKLQDHCYTSSIK